MGVHMVRVMFTLDTLQITPEILNLISGIDEFKGTWRALGTLAPERLRALRRVATIESIGSSTRIEGSSLTDQEVERLLSNLDIGSFASRDEQEVAGYAEVMQTIFDAFEELPITENYIKQFHRGLLRHSEKDTRHRGEYKKLSNSVAAFDDQGRQIAIVFQTASPFDTPRRMSELVEWFRQARESRQFHPLLLIAVFTVVFLEIHPFQDGNGRLSRVLTTLLLLQAGYAYVPYSSLESVIENSKEGYYIGSFASRDEQEVAGYAEVMQTIFDAFEELPITENYIKQFHRGLLRHSEKDTRHRGEYKKLSNSVAAFDDQGRQIAIVFQTASPFDTPRRMSELVEWFRQARESRQFHPLLLIAVFTVVFLEIHPFQDGNGRLSRVLTTLLLLQAGYAYVPYSSLESVIENSKEGYYLALRQTQATIREPEPNWQPWLLFFLRSLDQQKQRLATKVERERLIVAALPTLSLQIVDHVRQHGRATMGEVIRLTGASRNTLKEHFAQLVDKQHLVKHGTGKGTWYALP